MKLPRYMIVLGVAGAMLGSCSENEYKVYDTTQKDSVFFEYYNHQKQKVDTLNYNFDFNIAHVYTVTIPVTLMGFPVDYDRTIAITVIPDSTTMVEGTHYKVTDARIPAGQVNGEVKIDLLRDNDPQLLEKSFTARFVIGENDDLKSVQGSSFKITYSDKRPDKRPEWWLDYAKIPVYSYENAQLFFDYFYRLAPEANIDVYNQIINAYGDYFVNARWQLGPFTLYENFLRDTVCIPLHRDHPEVEFYSDPEW